jgi:hypothetical protein
MQFGIQTLVYSHSYITVLLLGLLVGCHGGRDVGLGFGA